MVLLWFMDDIWGDYNDLTVLPSPGIMVEKRNHPQMAQHFRLVSYYNLPRYMSKGQKMVCTDLVFGRRHFQKSVISCEER